MRTAFVVVVVAACFALIGCESAAPALPPAGPGAADITIVTQPPGAAVVVDGQPHGQSPVTLKLNPGPHRLRAAMSGYYPVPETKIVVERSVAATHTLTLVASH
ncbi:MAG: PEGA domain-containing protein [Deltaproteobacteria bacterium]|nr:PEGA domain-containing protein [Deltaproteobacteria bacterium]